MKYAFFPYQCERNLTLVMKKKTLRLLTASAVFAAVLCVTAPFSLPIGIIPISLATFSVYLASATLGWRGGTLAVICYVALGAAGLPVFAGFAGGIGKLLSPTGGFIIGYIPCAALCGLISRCKHKVSVLRNLLGIIAGAAACYACGILGYMLVTSSPFSSALTVCVIPFILPEIIKIVLASVLSALITQEVIQRLERTNE